MLCSSKEDCIAFDAEDLECQKDQGCFTEENIRGYLDWCKRGFEQIEREMKRKELEG